MLVLEHVVAVVEVLRTSEDVAMPVQVVTAKRAAAVVPSRQAVNHTSATTQAANHTRVGSDARASCRTKGRVRYEKLPTGEVVASIVHEAVATTGTSAVSAAGVGGASRRAAPVRGGDTDSVAPPDSYPINRWNVVTVVEEAHRATQSMRILLTSMREELRRAGGLAASDASSALWTDAQRTQRLNVARRLTVAYQSYRQSISDIEQLRFRNRNVAGISAAAAAGNSARLNVVLSDGSAAQRATQDFAVKPRRAVARSSDQVIDLTD